jgi:hypothetical protein
MKTKLQLYSQEIPEDLKNPKCLDQNNLLKNLQDLKVKEAECQKVKEVKLPKEKVKDQDQDQEDLQVVKVEVAEDQRKDQNKLNRYLLKEKKILSLKHLIVFILKDYLEFMQC